MCNFCSAIILKWKTVLAPVFNQSHICSNMKNFGKTVFLTKEEAEAALAKLESEV